MPKEQSHLSTASIEDMSISVKNLTAVKTCIVLRTVADSAVSGTVACLYNPQFGQPYPREKALPQRSKTRQGPKNNLKSSMSALLCYQQLV